MVCPKCGYQRTEKDDKFVRQEECPKCGLIYAKYKEPSLISEPNPEKETVQENPETLKPVKNKRNYVKFASVAGAAVLVVSVSILLYNRTVSSSPKNQVPKHDRDLRKISNDIPPKVTVLPKAITQEPKVGIPIEVTTWILHAIRV